MLGIHLLAVIKRVLYALHTMNTGNPLISGRTCALAIGLIFVVLGIAGFIPGLVSLPANAVSAGAPLTGEDMPLTAGTDYVAGFVRGFGYLFGIFPTNTLHNTLHVVLGCFGLYSAMGDRGSYNYNRFCAVFLPIVALLGLLPATNSLFGIMPIYGNNIWISVVAGAIALYGILTSKPSGEQNAYPAPNE
jgi:Domain of unknown function (DUF4383)